MTAIVVIAGLVFAAPAAAQIDDGREALGAADFNRAIRAFDAAERGALDRAGYVTLLEGRAIARWATGDAARARSDLARLGAIDPTHAFPSEAPPDVVSMFAETVAARPGPIAAAVRWSGETLEVAVANDDLALIASIRTHVRSGNGAWSMSEAPPPSVQVPVSRAPGESLAAWVELVGPGGAVLAVAGSESRPILSIAPPLPEEASGPSLLGATRRQDDDDGGVPVVWIVAGGSAAIALGVVIALLVVASGGDATGAQPDAPVVVGF